MNPPSLTPTAPGDGIPDTVANSTDCNVIIWNILNPFKLNAQYTQYGML